MSLYLFEGYVTYKKYLNEKLFEKQKGEKWDRRSRVEIYEDLKKLNNEITMVFFPGNHLNKNDPIFSLSGVSNTETIFCNENGYYSIYQSDRYGFNNPNDSWDKKEIEYLLVGDSFTHGACVNRPNDIASILRTLSSKSVLNLGYNGNSSLIEYATLREYLNPNVKKVLWIYYEGNDLKDLLNEKNDKVLINYLNNLDFTQNLKLRQNEINDLSIKLIEKERKAERKSEKVKNKTILKRFIKLSNVRFLTFPSKSPPPEFKKILELTKKLTVKNNSKLYFVYLPEKHRYKKKYDNTNYILVKDIVSKLDIPFIDIHKEVIEKEGNLKKLFPIGFRGHYSVKGYKKIAETIYKLTKDKNEQTKYKFE